jgi:polysaccharide deacetylase family protein (PEP-CTERM system associated)
MGMDMEKPVRNALTVDVENTQKLLDLLDCFGVRATFFVLGYVADQFPDLIRRVALAGHEIALHGYHHRRICQLSPDEFRADLLLGRAAVEAASGQRVTGFRAPMFSIDRSALWALDLLRDQGFEYDSSVFPTRNMLYGFPDAPRFPYRPFDRRRAGNSQAGGDLRTSAIGDNEFVEFPLSTLRLLGINWPVAGGFYLRLVPYPLFRWALRRLNRSGHPAILYIHPWELDPGQPHPHPTPRERFTHYHNLRRTESKLAALLRDFRFGTLAMLRAPEVSDPVMCRAQTHSDPRLRSD